MTANRARVVAGATPMHRAADLLVRPRPPAATAASGIARKIPTWPAFVAANCAVLALVLLGLATNDGASASTAVYVVVLCVICTLPLAFSDNARGRQSLAIVFLGVYFLSFAAADLVELLTPAPVARSSAAAGLATADWLVIVSALAFLAGYGLRLSLFPARPSSVLSREWSRTATVVAGTILWACGFVAVFFVQTDFEAVQGSPLWGPLAGVISLGRLLNPLGALMVAYIYLRERRRPHLALFVLFCILDFALGFYGDTKEQAFRDPILFLFAWLLVVGTVPRLAIVVVVALAGLSFTYFADYRDLVQNYDQSRTGAATEVLASGAGDGSTTRPLADRFRGGLEYLASRTNLKSSVQTIVARTGVDVPFQNGRTIALIAYAFIPRNVMPGKPDAAIGRLFNKEFQVSENPDVYISASQNGELYWNFGWTGVVFGMLLIGMLLASVNSIVNLEHRVTLPRLLLLLLTAYLLCLRFEDGIAVQYTYWLRAMALLLLMHWLMPKAPALAR